MRRWLTLTQCVLFSLVCITCKSRDVKSDLTSLPTAVDGNDSRKLSAFEEYLAVAQPSSFMDLTAKLTQDGYKLEHTFLPKGRSLVKDKVSHKQPRIIVAISRSDNAWPKPDLSNRVFFGYAEKPQQIEVISWNDHLGKLEFLVGSNVAPKSSATNPGNIALTREKEEEVCTACHHGGTPLFSAVPWADTTIFPYTREQVRAQTGDSYLGLPLPQKTDASIDVRFQTVVEKATELLEIRAVIPRVCDGNVACNSIIIKNAFYRVFNPSEILKHFNFIDA